MFGYPYIPDDTYTNAVNGAEGFASMSERWHKDADKVAGKSPKLAARMRDVAKAYGDLAFLCAELKRASVK